jgi:uncharacterized protein YggT (Ycf19 family)
MEIIEGLLRSIDFILNIYLLLIVATGVLRMARADESSPLMRSVATVVDPPANWLRRRFPRLVVRSQNQYVDLSPFALLLLVGVVQIMLPRIVMWIVRSVSF